MRHRRIAVAVSVAVVLTLAGCGEDTSSGGQTGTTAVGPATSQPAPSPVDVRASIGQRVEVETTVHEVLHANAFVVVDGQVGPEPVLVTTGVMPIGMAPGSSVVVTGRVIEDPPGSDPVMNEYKARGPIIEAVDVRLR